MAIKNPKESLSIFIEHLKVFDTVDQLRLNPVKALSLSTFGHKVSFDLQIDPNHKYVNLNQIINDTLFSMKAFLPHKS